ncbi:MAG: MFS transporter [Polyangiaceae bacterium]
MTTEQPELEAAREPAAPTPTPNAEAAATAEAPPPPRAPVKRPWWIPHFLGKVPEGVETRELNLLGAVSLALTFEEYDQAMLTSALKQIAGGLGIVEKDISLYLGIIRAGAVPAFFVVPLADRIGRRRVFLGSLAATAFFTFLTAFSLSPAQFVVTQMLARTFIVAGSASALVMVTEEFPASHRGWGIGMAGALGVIGHGFAAIAYAFINVLPFGWRSLYAFGGLPLLLMPWFGRVVPETRRFTERQAALDGADGAGGHGGTSLRSLVELFTKSPARSLGISAVAFLPSIGLVSAFQFTSYFAQTVHGWAPRDYSIMIVVGGMIGIAGNVAAGYLGDRIGRRLVGFALLGLFPLFVTAFYRGPGITLPIVWAAFMFCAQGGRMVHRALANELFPTAYRGAASGLYAILETVGAATGLFFLYFSSKSEGDLARITPYLSIFVAVGGAIILLFPETKQRELDKI